MYVLIWHYRVRAGCEAQFLDHYGPKGSWERLFARAPGYMGTDLLKGAPEAVVYLTVDRWGSVEDHLSFLDNFASAYHALDAECEALTEAETFVGAYRHIPAPS